MDVLLSLDVGTTAAKCVLYNLEGRELATAESAFSLSAPHPDWVEQEPEQIWQAVLKVLSEIGEKRNDNYNVLAIGLATQGGSTVPTTIDGDPTWPVITWMDRRAADVVARWKNDGSAELIRSRSGWTPEPGLPMPVIGWFKENREGVFSRSQRWLSINDFIAFRLCGQFATNPSMAGEMLLTDIRKTRYDEELCRLVGITTEHLSPMVPSDAIMGHLSAAVSSLTGLQQGTPIIAGGQDHSCEALAIGMTTEGTSLLACGTAWVINGVTKSSDMEKIPGEMNLNFHVIPDCWTISQFLGGLGASSEWWINQRRERSSTPHEDLRKKQYEAFNQSILDTAPGANGLIFLPLTGGRHQVESNPSGGFIGLTLQHTHADMGRAILESAAYELNWALEKLTASGMPINQMWMIGGATRSPVWPQIIADAANVEILLTQYSHGPALGAAILAGVGMGVFKSTEEGRETFQVNASRITPQSGNFDQYASGFRTYKKTSQTMRQRK